MTDSRRTFEPEPTNTQRIIEHLTACADDLNRLKRGRLTIDFSGCSVTIQVTTRLWPEDDVSEITQRY